MDAVQIAAFDIEFTRLGCATAKHDSIIIIHQLLRRNILADFGIRHEADAFGSHQVDTALHDRFVQLHGRNAVHQESADPVGAFIDGHVMARLVQLGCGGQPRRARADDGHAFAGPFFRRGRNDPAFFETFVDDRLLDRFDRYRLADQAHGARAFARSRAYAAK